VNYRLSFTEKIIRVFLNPVISGILILIIIGGIYFELQTPGVGFPLAASVVAAIFYFVPYYLSGLAANWEIVVFFIGVILLMVELFVIPGFGVAGISGIVLMVGSLILVMLNNDFFDFTFVPDSDIAIAAVTTISALIVSIFLLFYGSVKLTESKMFRKVSLTNTQQSSEGFTSNFNERSYIGLKGTAYTVLRPSGKIMIEHEIKDAFTRGEYIEMGKVVEVIDQSGSSLKVREVV
jgi:membrane-bound serine protease (ClpP class)